MSAAGILQALMDRPPDPQQGGVLGALSRVAPFQSVPQFDVVRALYEGVRGSGDALHGKFSPQPEMPGMLTEGDVFRQDMAGQQELGAAGSLAGMATGGSMPFARAGALGSGGGKIVQPETIVSATYTTGGKTYTAPNHFDAMSKAATELGIPESELFRHGGRISSEGFMTSTGRIVNREEAGKIAEAASQAKTKHFLGHLRAEELNKK